MNARHSSRSAGCLYMFGFLSGSELGDEFIVRALGIDPGTFATVRLQDWDAPPPTPTPTPTNTPSP